MWRVVNFRSFLLVLLCSSFTVVALACFPQRLKSLFIVVLFTCVLVLAVLTAVYRDAVKSAAFFIAALFMTVVVINYSVTIGKRESELTNGAAYSFSGRIESVVGSVGKTAYIIGDVTADAAEIDGNVYLRIEETDGYTKAFLRAGDIIAFSCELEFYVADFEDSYYLRNDIRYIGYVSESDVSFVTSDPTFFQRIRDDIKNVFDANLGEYSAVAYGMLVGEKNGIEDDVRDYYSASGLGHILAVSGLHIGFVTLIVSWLTKKFKASKPVDLIVNAVVLVFYCFLASFSASVVRAAIMCVVGKLAMTFGKQGDTLNSLSLALSVILLIWPYSLFDVGFQMSAAAVYGILLFVKPLEKVLVHILPKFLTRSLSVSTAAQIGITPIVLYHFHTFPVYSIITNLICGPLVSVGFIAITLALLLTLLIPSFGMVLSVAALPLVLLDDIARIVARLPVSGINVFAVSIVYVLFLLYFIVSSFFMLPRFKRLTAIVAVVASLSIVAVCNVPFDKSYDLLTAAAYKDVTVIARIDDRNIIIGDACNYSNLEAIMTAARLRDIDAVYLTSLSESSAETLEALNEKYGIGAVFVPLKLPEKTLGLLSGAGLDFYVIDERHVNEYGIGVVYGEDDFVGYTYTEDGVTVLIVGYGKTTKAVPTEVIDRTAIIRCYAFRGNFPDRIYITNYDNAYVEEAPLAQVLLNDSPIAFDASSGRVKLLEL